MKARSARSGCWKALRVSARLWLLRLVTAGTILAGRGVAEAQLPSPEALPAKPPVGGFFWTWVVPVLLFAVALMATIALYRHFSKEDPGASRGKSP